MNRLFDKTNRVRSPLQWLGTRPVENVRAAERRAISASRPAKSRAGPIFPILTSPFR
jgi:hypothetical protein